MGLKMGRAKKAVEGIKQVAAGVQPKPTRGRTSDDPLPSQEGGTRKTSKFDTIQLTGSKGQTYNVTVPSSYLEAIPKVWEWTQERYRVAELIAEGVPIAHIANSPDVGVRSRMTIYAWLEHPEFREHVDYIIMDTGWANRRERIHNLVRLQEKLVKKVMDDIDKIKLSDKSIAALAGAIQMGSKLIAQEKGEFVEESKVTSDVNMSGAVGTMDITARMDDYINGAASEDERKLREKEFDQIGDDIIRSLTGAKDTGQ